MSILSAHWLPNPLPSDRTPGSIIIRRLRRQIAVYEGTMKLPFVPGGLGMTPVPKGLGSSVKNEGVTMADKFHALSSYMRAGVNVLQFGFEFDTCIEDITRTESIDFERLTALEHEGVRREENRLVAELTADRCRKGL